MPGLGCPGSHTRTRARTIQVDRTAGSVFVSAAIRREMPLVRAPAEFGRLRALAHEALHRPGVDELVRLLGHVCDLSIALGDMNDLDTQGVGKLGPLLSAGGISRLY